VTLEQPGQERLVRTNQRVPGSCVRERINRV
jgi:hypothetical protein